MFLSLMDKVEFITEKFHVRVDEVIEDSFKLRNGNIICIKDAQCMYYYKGEKYFENADMSIELRDYFIDKFGSQDIEGNSQEKKIRYCRYCVGVIADEMENLANREKYILTDSDRLAFNDNRERLDEQAARITKELKGLSFRRDLIDEDLDDERIF